MLALQFARPRIWLQVPQMPSSSWRPTVQFSSPHPPLPLRLVTLIQTECGFQYPSRCWNCSPTPPLETIGTKSIPRCWHRSLYLLLVVFVSSAALVTVPAFGLRRDSPHAPAPEWLTAVGFTMLTSKARLFGQRRLPQTCPSASASVCLLLPFAEVPRATKLLSTEPVAPENFSLYFR
jgi:hypothetical protein